MPDPSKKTTSLSWIPLNKKPTKRIGRSQYLQADTGSHEDAMPLSSEVRTSQPEVWWWWLLFGGWAVIVLCGWCNSDFWWTNLLARKVFLQKKSRGNMSPMEDWSDLVLVSTAPAGRRFPFQYWKVPFMHSVIAIFLVKLVWVCHVNYAMNSQHLRSKKSFTNLAFKDLCFVSTIVKQSQFHFTSGIWIVSLLWRFRGLVSHSVK